MSAKKEDMEGIFDVQTLFGKRDELIHEMFANQLINEISKTSNRSLMLSIGLKENKQEEYKKIIKPIMEIILKNKIW
jgi:hypothetical protein